VDIVARIMALRQYYHREVCAHALFMKAGGKPSIADVSSKTSVALARSILDQLGYPVSPREIPGQTAGNRFEEITKDFLRSAFGLLHHLRPGDWRFSVAGNIAEFDQYQHIAELSDIVKTNEQLRTVLGDYVIKPDIIVARTPVSDEDLNKNDLVVEEGSIPHFAPLRASNKSSPLPILHASISCKLTIRSDRSQNARTEALNLIRNRKGHTPHIVAITAEPMPGRIASLAMGTGDIDCVYHFALHELINAMNSLNNEPLSEVLHMMIDGRRLRDISDLPFDLVD
jgi:hypothetical protein